MALPAANLLANETSPYLRQHADNPVHWRAWNADALREAQQSGKPILLSVGYAACHWCHVMAHECFEDAEVADLMNAVFVNIKVDREERPDIDQIYMASLAAMGEQGGWPLTLVLTPNAEPFWGGTYFPKTSRYGRPGFTDVIRAINRHWQEHRDKVSHNVAALRQHLTAQFHSQSTPAALQPDLFDQFAANVYQLIDQQDGGMRGAPKFPSAPFVEALWLSWLRTKNTDHRDAFLLTLRRMLQGGIYDHAGGGLSRYSVDERWLAPHFEKMLYDNAQMIRHATFAYAETGDVLFRNRIEQTVGWLVREMLTSDGAFAASLDADSEGEEGKFYVWDKNEVDTLLGQDELFNSTYDVTEDGNWEHKTILNRLQSMDALSDEDETKLAAALQTLFDHREDRIWPTRDDKILTDWNGLMIRALAEAGRVLERPAWIDLAEQTYRSVSESMEDGRLPHARLGSVKRFPCFSSDYAAMINAALSLYQCSFEPSYLEDARHWVAMLDQWHARSGGGYSMTAVDADDILFSLPGDQDEAIPSATGQIVEALTRLSAASSDMALSEKCMTVAEDAVGRIAHQKYGISGIMNAASLAIDPWKLVIVAPDHKHPLVTEANRTPDPRRADIFVPVGADAASLGLTDGTLPDTTKPAAFLCRGLVCLAPVTTAEELRSLLTGTI